MCEVRETDWSCFWGEKCVTGPNEILSKGVEMKPTAIAYILELLQCICKFKVFWETKDRKLA